MTEIHSGGMYAARAEAYDFQKEQRRSFSSAALFHYSVLIQAVLGVESLQALFVIKTSQRELRSPVTGNEVARFRFLISWNFVAALFAAVAAALMEIAA